MPNELLNNINAPGFNLESGTSKILQYSSKQRDRRSGHRSFTEGNPACKPPPQIQNSQQPTFIHSEWLPFILKHS